MYCAASTTGGSPSAERPIARRRRGFRTHKRRRAVSDVVATILLLALTVVLFASIFAFVSSFPAPPAQNSNQFQAKFYYQANASAPGTIVVSALAILHLAGPSVPGSALVYLKSARFPAAPQYANPITVAAGTNNSVSWNLGQTWFYQFPSNQQPILPDNITIYITTPQQLLFSVVLPGQSIGTPPTVLQTWTSPAEPGVGVAFVVYAIVSGNPNNVTVDLTAVPGAPAGPEGMHQNALGQWYRNVSAGVTTTNGSFVGFVKATNTLGQTGSGTLTVIIAASTISVAVSFSLNPAVQGVSETIVATLTYSGVGSAIPVAVAFWAAQGSTRVFSGVGPSGQTITGSGTATYLSTTTWSVPFSTSSYTVTTAVNATGVGSARGSLSFIPAPPLSMFVFFSSGSTLTSTCTNSSSGTCPLIEANLWDNGTGTSAIAYTVKCFINNTATGKSFSPAITGSPASITPGTIVLFKTTNHWQPVKTTSYLITVVVTITGVGSVSDYMVFNDIS